MNDKYTAAVEALRTIVNLIDAPHFNSARKYKIRELAATALEQSPPDSDALDARRYRWLRDNDRGRALSMSALDWSGDAIRADAAIDAAMTQENKP